MLISSLEIKGTFDEGLLFLNCSINACELFTLKFDDAGKNPTWRLLYLITSRKFELPRKFMPWTLHLTQSLEISFSKILPGIAHFTENSTLGTFQRDICSSKSPLNALKIKISVNILFTIMFWYFIKDLNNKHSISIFIWTG